MLIWQFSFLVQGEFSRSFASGFVRISATISSEGTYFSSIAQREQIGSVCHSPRSKRFCLVSGQKKNEEGDFWFWPREKWNESQKMKDRGGRGEGRKEGNACCQTLRFWKSAFASERSAWLAQLVEQYWHVSIKGLFHTGRSCVVRDTHLRASLHGGGGPQIGEVTCGGSPHLPCKRSQIKMRDYMDRRATPPKRVTSPNWGLPPACKQALNFLRLLFILVGKKPVHRSSIFSSKSVERGW